MNGKTGTGAAIGEIGGVDRLSGAVFMAPVGSTDMIASGKWTRWQVNIKCQVDTKNGTRAKLKDRGMHGRLGQSGQEAACGRDGSVKWKWLF